MSTNLIAITMPKWGLSMKEGSILKWIKSNGDNISKGDMILEIETEKVVNEMESPEDGKIIKICANEGDTVPVGSIIAVCGKQDASNEENESNEEDESYAEENGSNNSQSNYQNNFNESPTMSDEQSPSYY